MMGSMPLFNNHHSEDLLDNKTAPRGFQYTQPWSPQEETADQILRGQQGEGWEAAVLVSSDSSYKNSGNEIGPKPRGLLPIPRSNDLEVTC